MNHLKFEERLAFVRSIVLQEFGVEPCEIEPIQYDPECEFPYNNFIYIVELSATIDFHDKRTADQLKPGTIRLPEDVSIFVMRLSNAAAGLNDVNRVENEVTAMNMFCDALSHISAHMVPKVYGWGSAAGGQGWIFQEYMAGKNLAFKTMTIQHKRSVLLQIAEIFGALQQYQLPDTVKDYGGLRFGEDGAMVSAPMTLIAGGPFQSYEAFYIETIHSQLIASDKSSILEGWKPNGVRKRLEQFLRHGLHQLICQEDSRRKALVHGDLSSLELVGPYPDKADEHGDTATDNLLFDPETMRVTAILDFDWSYVGTTADEFLRSFGDISGKLPGPFNKSPEMSALRVALLQGFPDPLPTSESSVSWDVAKSWDDELERRNIQRPRTIDGIDVLSGAFWLSQQICPFLLCNPTVLKYRTLSQIDRDKEEAEKLLITYMETVGF